MCLLQCSLPLSCRFGVESAWLLSAPHAGTCLVRARAARLPCVCLVAGVDCWVALRSILFCHPRPARAPAEEGRTERKGNKGVPFNSWSLLLLWCFGRSLQRVVPLLYDASLSRCNPLLMLGFALAALFRALAGQRKSSAKGGRGMHNPICSLIVDPCYVCCRGS